jgi:hypothetical protein
MTATRTTRPASAAEHEQADEARPAVVGQGGPVVVDPYDPADRRGARAPVALPKCTSAQFASGAADTFLGMTSPAGARP